MADTDMHIVEQIKLASGKRDIARILLQAPDAILMSHAEVLSAECRRAQFIQACHFIDLRVAALDARRDRAGLLPSRTGLALEHWRTAFASFAASSPR